MLKVSKLTVGVVLLCATSAHAVELPDWNAARICNTENSNGECSLLKSVAEQTIASARATLPDAYGSACLNEIKEPSTANRGPSPCPELQAGYERILLETGNATPSSTLSHDGKIETPRDYFKYRDSLGFFQDPPLQTRLIRLAALPSPATDVPQAFFQIAEEAYAGEESETELFVYDGDPGTFLPRTIAAAGSLANALNDPDRHGELLILAQSGSSEAAAPQAEVPRDQIDKALADLLAERESWGTEPSIRSAAGTSAEPGAATAASEPTDLAGYLARRNSWGTGAPPKPVNAPLAAGAVSPLPAAASTTAAATSETPPVVHPVEQTPAPQLTEVPRDQIEKSLAELLIERESWGTEPSSHSAAAAPAETPSASADSGQPVTDLAGYLARRDSWGTGAPPKPVNAPLAAGAVSPLPAAASPTAAASETPPVVHPLEETPAPQLTEVPRGQIEKSLAELLIAREGWTAQATAVSPEAEPQTADAAACAADLREALARGTVLFGRNSATLDRASFTTLDQISERARACRDAFIIVEGHTDDVGSEDMNLRLSEQRATAVMKYLVAKGVNSDRIEAVGFGKTRPLVPNTSNENRAKNRRIELRAR